MTAFADIAVVVNPENRVSALKEREVMDLFMGRYVAFPDGKMALPLDLPVNSPTREKFYKKLTGKGVAQINAYWAKLIFSGRAIPPRALPNSEEIIKVVSNNKNAIGYMHPSDVTSEVKVVLLIKE